MESFLVLGGNYILKASATTRSWIDHGAETGIGENNARRGWGSAGTLF
jgi:hypothetical protein